uniref:Putative 26 kDa salivary gland protein a n=1 Tax=Ixodes ricinus TaxID=34613 RepID=A0A147BWZ2_IXORI
MKALITAPLFALLSFVALEDLTPDDISGTMKKAKTRKCHTPENPIVTIGYILHGFNVTTGVKRDTEFYVWQNEVLKKAKEWLQSYKVNILLENTTVRHASSAQSTKIEEWTRENWFRSPFTLLEYLKADIKNTTMYNPDIVILFTKVPVTLYDFGFGSYEPLCYDVVPMFLTYNKSWVDDVGDLLGQVILNSLNINNYNTWHRMSAQDRKRYFDNCVVQRFGKDYF